MIPTKYHRSLNLLTQSALCLAMLASPLSIVSAKPKPPAEYKSLASYGKVKTLNAGKVDMTKMEGNVTVVVFFASWCAPARENVKMLNELFKEKGGSGLKVMGMHPMDQRSTKEGLSTMIKEDGIKFPVSQVQDADFMKMAETKNVDVPQVLIYSKDGKLVKALSGFNPSVAEQINSAVNTLIQ
jgi:thiol-disulfide isomerase/thioredoxin